MENEDTIHYWTFFHKGLANHNDLTLDFYLNDEFNKAFNDLSYVVMTSDKLSLKDKPEIHNADQATIQKYRKEKLNSMYETINYQKLSHEVIKNGFRLTGIKIPRWSYIIFKIRLKYRVDHSFVTIYEIKDQKQIQKYSGYYSPKKMHIADNSPLSIIIYILCGLIIFVIIGTIWIFKRKRQEEFVSQMRRVSSSMPSDDDIDQIEIVAV